MREVILDTETTGLDPALGHRIVEIGALELLNHLPTGRTFHVYLNPQRDVPAEAEAVHGLSTAFLRDKPLFSKSPKNFWPSSPTPPSSFTCQLRRGLYQR